MSKIDLNIGLSDCIWKRCGYNKQREMNIYNTACGRKHCLDDCLDESSRDNNGYSLRCPECGNQVRVENKQ